MGINDVSRPVRFALLRFRLEMALQKITGKDMEERLGKRAWITAEWLMWKARKKAA